jgi:hypothetical protein
MRGGLLAAESPQSENGGNGDEILTGAMSKQTGGHESGSNTLNRPDEYPGSPFTGGCLPSPRMRTFTVATTSELQNFTVPNRPVTQLCGLSTENCPAIRFPHSGGYVGGPLQMQTNLAVVPAGDVWRMNNWKAIMP